METTKNCKHCGKLIERRIKRGKAESVRDFRRRQFCDKRCSSKFQHSGETASPSTVKSAAAAAASGSGEQRKSAIEFLEDIVNDATADKVTRVNAAKALLPYQEESRNKKPGKKEEKHAAAKEAAGGKFGAMCGPKVVSIKK